MIPENLSREAELASKLARRAGEAVLAYYHEGVRVDYKGPGDSDPVTPADREANRIIVEGLKAAFPDDAILAEESPVSNERLSKPRLWCVDPLDGTRDFIDRTGDFVVMIGLAVGGEARLGVVYQPTQSTLYWGFGREAFVERKAAAPQRLTPSSQADPRQAVLVVSRSHRSKTVTRLAHALGVAREQPLGSVGLKVAYVARGDAELYLSVSERTHEWDACAPEAILRAAGGRMTDALGAPLRYNKPVTNTPRGLLATNGLFHDACVAALKPIAQERGWL